MIAAPIETPLQNADEFTQFMFQKTLDIGHEQLFLLIDLCDIQVPLLTTIASWQPKLNYWLLFEQTPEAVIAEQGPVLLVLDIKDLNHQALLEKIGRSCYDDNRLIGFNSIFPPELVAQHLRTALQLQWQEDDDEQEGLLRYYTPDLFEAVNMILSPAQYQWFHQYTLQWFYRPDGSENQHLWIDTANQPQSGLSINGLVFTQMQYNLLLLWGDVFAFYHEFSEQLPPEQYGGKRLLLLKLYERACAASEAGIYSQDKLEQYFWDGLNQ